MPSGQGGEKIDGPLYDLARIRAITAGGTGVLLWTRDCTHNVQDLGWEAKDVIELLHRLEDQHYIDSEWCENGHGVWAACDAYRLDVKEWIETARKDMVIRYFVNFAISKTGSMVLTVSCHTS